MALRNGYPLLQALAAAFLFGASAPLAKLLLRDIEPALMAGLLYLGSGIGLLVFTGLRKAVNGAGEGEGEGEARLARSDIRWLAAAILAGGVAAPITLLFSLRETPAATASLLLNFECAATTLIAALLFGESISRRAWGAIFCITAAGVLLSTDFRGAWGLSIGALGVVIACIFWGLDNNFTRNISAKDPLMIVTVKGFSAGLVSLGIGFLLGNPLPGFNAVMGAMLLGCISYGSSIVLFIHAMRSLGAGRTSALFGTAPIAGIILSVILFRETPDWVFMVALPVMIAGTMWLATEEHHHEHRHEEIVHDHRHCHDDGHHDGHLQEDHPCLAHSHPHVHKVVRHTHHHLPDIHHPHGHASKAEG